MRAWRVVGEGVAESRFDARQAGAATLLVGREHELGLLLDRWARAKDGEGQVVLLSGEPGIGKSRLVRALRERLAGEPHTWLGQFCSPYHANTALHPVIGLLERAAGLRREDPTRRQLDKLEAMLARAVDDARRGGTRSRGPARHPGRGALPVPRPQPAAAEGADLPGAARPARRAGGRRARCWPSTRTSTGPTRPPWS